MEEEEEMNEDNAACAHDNCQTALFQSSLVSVLVPKAYQEARSCWVTPSDLA
jgi:hypothetical protein